MKFLRTRRLMLLCALVFTATRRLEGQIRTFAIEPEVRIAGDFSRFGDLAVGPSGALAAAQPFDSRILFFDRNGKQVGAFGRHGAGPGEFLNLSQIGISATGYWAYDSFAARLTFINRTFTVERTLPGPTTIQSRPNVLTDRMATASIMAVTSKNQLIMDGLPIEATTASRSLISTGHAGRVFLLTRPDGAVVARLGSVPAIPECVRASGISAVVVPFCPEARVAVANDGSRIVLVEFDLSRAPSFRVSSINSSGDTTISRSYPVKPIRIPQRFADSVVAGLRRSAPIALTGLYSELTLPSFFPPVQRVITSDDGNTWLEMFQPGTSHRWLALDPAGTPIGELSVPSHVRLGVINGTSVWAVVTDDNDVETLVRYRLRTAR